jgi:beta-lactamase regulating signal transducer with metallopeptidase domain
MITILNQMAEKWYGWELAMLWQAGLLIAIVAAIDLLIKKWAWPQVRYALWLLILVKLVLPPGLTSPTSFTAEIPFMVSEDKSTTNITTDCPPHRTCC